MGRDRKNEGRINGQFVPLLHSTMDTPAWRALTPYAMALYPYLKRLAGHSGGRNGTVACAVREAADYLGVSKTAAGDALHDLQAKGFLVVSTIGTLGVSGHGKASTFRLTEIGTPVEPRPTKEFLEWKPGSDFPVKKGRAPVQKNKTLSA